MQLKPFATTLAGVMLAACSAYTEPDTGSCSLKCNKPRAAGAEFILEPLNKEHKMAQTCDMKGDENDSNPGDNITPTAGPVEMKFRVLQKVNLSDGPAAGGAQGLTDPNFGPQVTLVPVANIGFEPVRISGSVAVEKSNTDLLANPTTMKDYKFAGIATPPSEWCSDVCGVMTFSVWPNCRPAGTTLEYSVSSGGAIESESYTVDVGPPFRFRGIGGRRSLASPRQVPFAIVGPMTDPWISLLANLPLSRTEREVVRRFESDPQGRTFLPVADILRSHRLVDESLELLSQGVVRHPGFTVARVVLARELLQKGMVAEAWRALEDSPVPLRENLLAQKLRFRLAVLLNLDGVVRATYQHLKLHQMLDAESKRLGDLIELSGLEAARDKLAKELRDRGTDLVLPDPNAAPTMAPVAGRGDSQTHLTGATASAYFREEGLEEDQAILGFHVVPLTEIFRPGDQPQGPRSAAEGIELDSTTLADIYARQGHFSKALEVYRRLLRMTPHNDLLRRKVADLTRLDREQRDVDLTVDPALVDRMESVEIIDRQIKFYNDLLGRLS